MNNRIYTAITILISSTIFNCLNGQIQLSIDNLASANVQNERSINQENLEFSPFFYRDFIGFVYSNPKSGKDNEISEYYFDLGFSAKGVDGRLQKRASFNKNINTEFHEGPACFDDKKGVLYFTRTYYDPSKLTKRDTIVRKIYKANERNDFKDAKIVELSTDKYSVCHPTLNDNGTTLYFASNKENSFGGMDLYASNSSNGNWVTSKHLTSLNTVYNEIFPFAFKNNILFFASDRPEGLGGLDIYVSTWQDSVWSKPQILPYPINSSYDDFGLIVNKGGTSGYFTSSRPGGSGKDDLYSFSTSAPMFREVEKAPIVNTSITVLDKLTLTPQADISVIVSTISLKNNKYNLDDFEVDVIAGEKSGEILMKLSPKANATLDTLLSNQKGQVFIDLPVDQKYLVRTMSSSYEPQYVVFDPSKEDSDLNIILNPLPKAPEPIKENKSTIVIPTAVGEVVVFNNIYYETNSSKIIPGAATELDALAKTMLLNLGMKVELSSHTDSRGTDSYNQDLSLKRALSAKQYLINKGVDAGRISALGFGESKIRNHCKNNIKCSDQEHQFNRRTEVKIVR